MTRSHPNGIFGKTGNGTLDLSVSNDSELKHSNIRGLDVSISIDDFDAIYVSSLMTVGIPVADTSGSYSWENFEENRKLFVSEFPQFPIVGAHYDMYQDHIFGPEDINSLLDECNVLRQGRLSPEADLAIRKLIYGCEVALKDAAILIFVCD